MKNEINHVWNFNHSLEEVWKFLTQSDLIAKWLMPNDFKLEEGYEFKFMTDPIPQMGLDGNFYCKVLEIVPLKKLVYSWKGGANENKITLDTVVEWRLESKGKGTMLYLLHTGFSIENLPVLTAMNSGWNNHMDSMRQNLNK